MLNWKTFIATIILGTRCALLIILCSPWDVVDAFVLVSERRTSTIRTKNFKECSSPLLSLVPPSNLRPRISKWSECLMTNNNDNNYVKLDKPSSSLLRSDQVDAIHQFASQLSSAVGSSNNDEVASYTLQSFVLHGPKAPRKNKKASIEKQKQIEAQKERLRGSIRMVQGRLIALDTTTKGKRKKKNKRKGSNDDKNNVMNLTVYVQATIKYHQATDIAQNWELTLADDSTEMNIGERIIDMMNPSSSRQGYADDDASTLSSSPEKNGKNASSSSSLVSEWGDVQATSALDAQELGFQSAELITAQGSWRLDMATTTKSKKPKKKASCRFVKNKESPSSGTVRDSKTNPDSENNVTTAPTLLLSHDQKKNVPLSPSSPFFQKLGISDVKGKPKVGMASKLRQCQKFVEIVTRLVNDYSTSTTSTTKSTKESSVSLQKPMLRTIDMGCGRGYLTFSLHSYFMDSPSLYNNFSIETRGVDMRPKLVKEINGIASTLGEKFENLQFVKGTIEDSTTELSGTNDDCDDGDNNDIGIDILIALHACDTATDDSIWYGIKRNSSIIVTAPCCHKEVRFYLDPHVVKLKKAKDPFADVLRHNIYKERIAETVTDSMRALLLEIANYDVKVFEFIGGEHTSKNVMISAVKRSKPRTNKQMDDLRSRLRGLAQSHGVSRQKLADWMNEDLVSDKGKGPRKKGRMNARVSTKTGMPSMI